MKPAAKSWLSALCGDDEIAAQFSDQAQFASFARFETALVSGLACVGRIDSGTADKLKAEIASFQPNAEAIAAAALRDGVPVPDYVRQLRKHVSGSESQHLHFGATSQDLVDTATVEALRQVSIIMASRLEHLLTLLDGLATQNGTNRLQAITRMQPALPFSASSRIAAWARPLHNLNERLPALRSQSEILQFGGAVGDLQSLGSDAENVAKAIARELDLIWPGHSWQTARAPLLAQAGWMVELSGCLGKIGQDVAIMALRGPSDIELASGGTSSAMPHKQNPVMAERLVALARINANLMTMMHQAQIQEMERSGAAWMLEWMALPQICETTGAALTAATGLVQSITRMGEPS